MNLANLLEKNIDTLAAVEALDNGKAVSLAKADIGMAAACIRYYGGWADKVEGKVIDTGPDTFNYTRQEPVTLVPTRDLTHGSHLPRLVSAVKSSHGTSPC